MGLGSSGCGWEPGFQAWNEDPGPGGGELRPLLCASRTRPGAVGSATPTRLHGSHPWKMRHLLEGLPCHSPPSFTGRCRGLGDPLPTRAPLCLPSQAPGRARPPLFTPLFSHPKRLLKVQATKIKLQNTEQILRPCKYQKNFLIFFKISPPPPKAASEGWSTKRVMAMTPADPKR